jgi:hypothetical protein
VTAIEANAHWRGAGLYVAIMLFGTVLGTIITIPVLYLAGVVVRIPGLQPLLTRFLTADFDAPLLWVLLVSSWLLGIVVIYVITVFVLKSRDAEPGN